MSRYEYDSSLPESSNIVLNKIHTTQAIAEAYFSCAHSYSDDFASSRSPVYKAMRKSALLAISSTYDMTSLKASRVLDVMTYSGEYDVDYAVDCVRNNSTSRAYER